MAIHQSPLNKFFAFERQQQIGQAKQEAAAKGRARDQEAENYKARQKLKLKQADGSK